MSKYIISYTLDQINLFRSSNLNGRCIIEASTSEWAATNFITKLKRLDIDVHVLGIEEIEDAETVFRILQAHIK